MKKIVKKNSKNQVWKSQIKNQKIKAVDMQIPYLSHDHTQKPIYSQNSKVRAERQNFLSKKDVVVQSLTRSIETEEQLSQRLIQSRSNLGSMNRDMGFKEQFRGIKPKDYSSFASFGGRIGPENGFSSLDPKIGTNEPRQIGVFEGVNQAAQRPVQTQGTSLESDLGPLGASRRLERAADLKESYVSKRVAMTNLEYSNLSRGSQIETYLTKQDYRDEIEGSDDYFNLTNCQGDIDRSGFTEVPGAGERVQFVWGKAGGGYQGAEGSQVVLETKKSPKEKGKISRENVAGISGGEDRVGTRTRDRADRANNFGVRKTGEFFLQNMSLDQNFTLPGNKCKPKGIYSPS